MASRKHGTGGMGVNAIRKQIEIRQHGVYKNRLPMETLEYMIDQFENTEKTDANRGKIRHVMNAAIAAGVPEARMKKEAGLMHAQFKAASNGNSPGLSRPQRHALLHMLREEVNNAKHKDFGHRKPSPKR